MWMLLDVYDKSLNSMDNVLQIYIKQIAAKHYINSSSNYAKCVKINPETAQIPSKK